MGRQKSRLIIMWRISVQNFLQRSGIEPQLVCRYHSCQKSKLSGITTVRFHSCQVSQLSGITLSSITVVEYHSY